jgi:hypothetical protein
MEAPALCATTSVGSSDDCKIQRSRHLAVGLAVFLCDDKRRRQVRHKRGSQSGTPRQASAAGSMPDAVASGKSPERANSSGGGQRRGPGTLAECLTRSSSTRSRIRTATAADWR